jgi:hypothetical protein
MLYNRTLNPVDNFVCGLNAMGFILTIGSGDTGIQFLNYALLIPFGILGVYLVARLIRGV